MKRKRDYEESSGNVFADLGFRNSKQELLKAKLTVEIYKLLKKRDVTQKETARAVALRHIPRLERRRHQEPAEGRYAGQPLPVGKAEDNCLRLAVPGDDGWFASCSLVHDRRQLRFGVLQLNPAHGIPHMTTVVMYLIVA